MNAGYAQGHVIVQFNGNKLKQPSGKNADKKLRRLGAALGLPRGARLRENGFARWKRRHRAGHQKADLDLDDFFLLELPENTPPHTGLERLRRHPLVRYAEFDPVGSGGATFPDDPDFHLQWHHYNTGAPPSPVRPDIHAPEAWSLAQGSTNIIVAVLDTGLAPGLVEFAGRSVPGYDMINNDADPADDHGHGTAVAGALAASANNSTLVAGVDWNCKLMPVKVLDSNNYGLYSQWAAGINWAVSNGCKVINLSAGGSSSSTTLQNAIRNAVARGVIFITITHNDGTGTIRFPGRMPETITVGATDSSDLKTSFSNYGPEIDLVAPGKDIYTVSRTGTRTKWYGTSFSAPLVAGVAAMAAGIRPDLDNEQMRILLCAGADDEVGDSLDAPGFDDYYGWGRLNARNTLVLAASAIRRPTLSSGGQQVQLTWTGPPNAADRTPYEVEHRSHPDVTWSNVSDHGFFVYSEDSITWQGTLNAGARSDFRVRIVNR
jgi:subtilisin family serine protease